MTDERLKSLLKRGRHGSESLTTEDSLSDTSAPGVVISCPGHHEPPALWPIESDRAATLSVLGTQTRKLTDSGLCTVPELDDVVMRNEPQNIAVVGHTDCSVIEDAYENYLSGTETSGGVTHRTAPISSLIKEATDSGLVGTGVPKNLAVHQLVEYNVVRQTEFLSKETDGDVTVAGYVHDRNAAYGDGDKRYRLVAVNHKTEPESILSSVPEDEDIDVSTLL
jgi:hypothetical protein